MAISVVGAAPAFTSSPTSVSRTAAGGMSDAELRMITELARRDREVRAHEAAHAAAGAGLVTRGASYTYQSGPDGQRYAVGGEVGIDTSPGRTPEETLLKAEQVRAAALAPAEPSGQDRQVAASAARMASEARAEIAARAADEASGASSGAARPGGVEQTYAAIAGGAPQSGSQIDIYA